MMNNSYWISNQNSSIDLIFKQLPIRILMYGKVFRFMCMLFNKIVTFWNTFMFSYITNHMILSYKYIVYIAELFRPRNISLELSTNYGLKYTPNISWNFDKNCLLKLDLFISQHSVTNVNNSPDSILAVVNKQ